MACSKKNSSSPKIEEEIPGQAEVITDLLDSARIENKDVWFELAWNNPIDQDEDGRLSAITLGVRTAPEMEGNLFKLYYRSDIDSTLRLLGEFAMPESGVFNLTLTSLQGRLSFKLEAWAGSTNLIATEEGQLQMFSDRDFELVSADDPGYVDPEPLPDLELQEGEFGGTLESGDSLITLILFILEDNNFRLERFSEINSSCKYITINTGTWMQTPGYLNLAIANEGINVGCVNLDPPRTPLVRLLSVELDISGSDATEFSLYWNDQNWVRFSPPLRN
jgi:hypothetical protein